MPESQHWRLITSQPQTGSMNMATDDSILESVAAGQAPPTLRLYAWAPACLSLGYAQPYADIDPVRIAERGWSIVRRPTGGRAILHTDELTYAVMAPITHPDFAGGVIPSYQRLSQALLEGLDQLGLQVSVAPEVQKSADERANPVCFEVPSAYEIEVSGRKLVGSAQVRRVKSVLQHGTLPLTGNITRICEALQYPDERTRQHARERITQRAASVSTLLGKEVSWDQAARAIIDGFERALGWEFHRSDLTRAEVDRALELESERYSNPEWTQRI